MESVTARVSLIKEKPADSKVVAMVTLLLNETFAVNKIKLIDGSKGVFVSMPSIKNTKGEFEDICHPITKEFRETVNKTIMDAYEVELAKTNVTESAK